jgi:hypothetical protein
MSDVSAATPARDPREVAARRHVAALKGFYIHLGVYVIVVAGLVLLDWLAGGAWWSYWVLLGWGIGVAGHAFGVFSNASQRVSQWEERKVQELLRADKSGPQ